jgi:hypothetical protein
MMKHLIISLLALFLASVSWSQDSEESSDTETEVADVAEATEVAEEEDDSDLDEQGFEQEDEDDFTPSEDVSADQSLAFPVDI